MSESTRSDRTRPRRRPSGPVAPSRPSATPTVSFGERLRRERESRDTTLDQIVDATRIDGGFFEALENDDFEALPGPAFGKFFIRAYAEALGVDARPWIADYDRERYRRIREGTLRPRRPAAVQEEGSSAASPETVEPPREEAGPLPDESAPVDPAPPAPAPAAVEPAQPRPAAPTVSQRVRWPAALTEPGRAPLTTLAAAALLVLGAWALAALGTPADPAPRRETTGPPVGKAGVLVDAEPVLPRPSAATTAGAAEVEARAPDEAALPVTPKSDLTVAEFGVGTRVVNRRLEGRGDRFEEGSVVWFSTRVLGGQPGDRIRHVWLRDGRPVQSLELELGGPHWRTHTSKTLWGTGNWAAEARATDGRVLARATFACVPPS